MGKVIVYVLPLNVDAIVSNRQSLCQKEYFIEILEDSFTPDTLPHLKIGIKMKKINMDYLCIVMKFQNGSEILIDKFGVAKFGGKEHYIAPSYYFYMRWMLTSMLYKKRGAKEWTVRIE